MATVLFSDIQGFTKIAEQMNPELLIDQLDAFFFHFDSVVEKFNIEKIKTIGDAYMCAGGIPNKNITNPVEVVLAALEVQEYMKQLQTQNSEIWDLRIGIHTGSVIAGVVGHKKLSYDIWGDTVNTASRMESSGEPGKVNISGHTYDLVKDFFVCEHRGKMPVKYKGEIDMYFVKGIRPELAVDMKNIPNKKFFVKLQLVRLQDVEEEVIELVAKDIPANLYFHNAARIRDIYGLVELFGRAEELNDEETLVLRTAGLLIDVGYIWSYDEHENESIRFARELLPKYSYTPDQVERVVDLIEATKRLRKPQSRLEEILLDADMNYLSRADFVTLSKAFFNELYERNKIGNKEEWLRMQIVLLSNHKYYTSVANMLRDVSPEHQIENIVESSKKTE
jgi:adenylate cyclase